MRTCSTKQIQLQFCATQEQRVDIFTKPLAHMKFDGFQDFLISSLKQECNKEGMLGIPSFSLMWVFCVFFYFFKLDIVCGKMQ